MRRWQGRWTSITAFGLIQTWLIDLIEDRIEVHGNPYNGIYQEVRIIQRGQKVVSNTIQQLKLKADEILG